MKLDIDSVMVIVRPLFLNLSDYHKFNANAVKVFTAISYLFPQIYADKIQVQMLVSDLEGSFKVNQGSIMGQLWLIKDHLGSI